MKNEAPLITGFAKLKFTDVRGRKVTRFIKVTKENSVRVVGTRVNADGSQWSVTGRDKDGTEYERSEFIVAEPNSIVARVALNTFYGVLENVV